MTDVLVVGDEVLVSVGLKMILETAGGFVVATSAGRHARSAAEECRPAVALVDAQTTKPDGLAVLGQLCTLTPPPAVAMLAALAPSESVVDALRAGSSGFLLKDTQPEQLVVAVQALATGATVLAPEAWSSVLRTSFRGVPFPGSSVEDSVRQLSQREQEVLRLLGLGLTNAGISRKLFLSDSTVKEYVSSILNKLGVANRVQAAVRAYAAGLTADDLASPS
ncbi:response regulator transcription factor, partial [Micromonospora sp. CNB394]|uniref:LuxR C-terminal-related transcriptional regulator n=1 Tax=Micromonospora sp. CNB394 TaxID=1169151 RepID=UPI0003669067